MGVRVLCVGVRAASKRVVVRSAAPSAVRVLRTRERSLVTGDVTTSARRATPMLVDRV